MYKKILISIDRHRSRIKLFGKIMLIFLPPFIFTYIQTFPWHVEYRPATLETQISTLPNEGAPILATPNEETETAKFWRGLLNIPYLPRPIWEMCLKNRNRILLDGEEKTGGIQDDEAGAMSVKNDFLTKELYRRRNDPVDCGLLTTNPINLKNVYIEFKNPNPTKVVVRNLSLEIGAYSKTEVDLKKSKLYAKPKIRPILETFVIILIFWPFLLMNCVAVKKWLKPCPPSSSKSNK